ncbi:MAG: conjugal transfer protein TraF [Gemmatimonadetes bacterium]|nr:conjugal transfer protein TraF [Gemmatimonadota bacterium]
MALYDLRPRGAQPLLAALVAIVLAATPAVAQLPSASTAALGMAENLTAAARGYDATAWNPANLGLHGNPPASGAVFAARGSAGLAPVGPGDLADFAGADVPRGVRHGWLDRIRAAGREHGSAGADLSIVSVQVRSIGFQLSTSARALADVSADAAELILFGNAGADGTPRDLTLADSRIAGAWTSTAALAFGHGLSAGNAGRLAFGVTAKYTLGHVLAYGKDNGSRFDADPLQATVDFPVITTDSTSRFDNGAGFGLDLGAAWQKAHWTAGVTLRNLANSFRWKEDRLRYRSAHAFFAADSSASADFDDERPFSAAPAALRREVLDLGFEPVLSAGVAFRSTPRLRVDADVRRRLGDGGLDIDPRTHAGVGAEFRPVAWLPLRAGAAYVTGGAEVAGGFGIELGSYALGASLARRAGSTLTMVTLISSSPR